VDVILLILIALLGHDRFPVRESAHAHLARLVARDLAVDHLLEAEDNPCLEIATRARHLLGPWFERHADELVQLYLPAGWSGFPWIDSLPAEWPGRFEIVCELRGRAIAAGFKACAPEWPCYREATRLWLRDLVAARQPVAELLEVLCEGHRAYCRKHGYAVPP
jgi:hypothetical protein